MPLTRRIILLLTTLVAVGLGSSVSGYPQTSQNLASQIIQCPGGTIDTFLLTGQVNASKVFHLADLQVLPPTEETVTFATSNGSQTITYIGVPLWDLIQAVGGLKPNPNPSVKNNFLRQYALVDATDCYQVIVALGEIVPNFEAKKVLVAYATKSAPDQAPQLLTTDGAFRLVVPGDQRGGRYVSNIRRIVILSAPNFGL